MKNIFILPTDKPSKYVTNYMENEMQWHNIYITSDEEIKKGDSVILKSGRLTKVELEEGILGFQTIDGIAFLYFREGDKKIILTTDQDLIKDGVQAIDGEFLEWFVKNPSCESVDVEKTFVTNSGLGYQEYAVLDSNFKVIEINAKTPQTSYYLGKITILSTYEYVIHYKTIIPQEKPKQELPGVGGQTFKIVLDKEWFPKQETLELKRNYQKHSLTKTKGYKLWCNIIQRCYNPKNYSYKYYGGKGVIMEDYFKNSYENFIDWIKGLANYENWLNSSELSLDRIDNSLGYIRGNIKFSTKTKQVENQNLRVDNKSGYKGVCYHNLNKKYGATITINKSKIFLGYYDTALEAALVYDNYILKTNLKRKTNL